jgi:hypothetical protein
MDQTKKYYKITASGCKIGGKGEYKISMYLNADNENQARDLLIEHNPKIIFSFINIKEVETTKKV